MIPLLAVPVSLIGTFAGLYLFGFSINTLTLFAMVLAIGIVVDDAIIVLENVERILSEEGGTVKEAAFKAISETLNDKYDISWKDIEVANDKNGRPSIHFGKINYEDIEDIDISISHCKEYACANVVILYK